MNSKKFLALACICIIILSFVCFSSSQENNNVNNNNPRPRPSGRHPRPEPTRRPRPQPSLRPRPEPSQQRPQPPRPQPSSRRQRPEPTKSYTLIEVNNPLNETLSPKSTKRYTLKLSNKQKVNLFYMQYGKNLKTSISIELSKARNVEGNVVIVGKTLKGNLLTCPRHTGCTYIITVTNNDEIESNNVLIQSVDSIATINGCNERPEATTASEGTRGRKRSPKGTIIATAVLGFLTALLIVCVFSLSLKLRKVKKELALLKKNVAVEQTAVVPNTELNEVESVEETNNLVQAQNNTFMNSQPVPQQFVNYTQYPQMYPVLMVPNTTHSINMQPINTQQKE